MKKKEKDKCCQKYSSIKKKKEKVETILFTIFSISSIALPIVMGVSFMIKSHTLFSISEIDLALMILTGTIMVDRSISK